MEGMVKDLRLAREKQQEFDNWKSNSGGDTGIDLTVTVLTTGFWPTYKAVDLALPEEMVSGADVTPSSLDISTAAMQPSTPSARFLNTLSFWLRSGAVQSILRGNNQTSQIVMDICAWDMPHQGEF